MFTRDDIGKVFYFKDSPEHKKRIVALTPNSVYTVEMNNGTKCVPRENSMFFLEEEQDQDRIIWENEVRTDTSQNLSINQKALAKKRWESIGWRWHSGQTQPLFLNRKTRVELINEIAQELGISEGHTRELLTQFWRGGMTKASLEPKKKNSKKFVGYSIGRKAKNGNGLIITPDIEDIFEKAYRKYHLKEGKTLEKTFSNLLRENYCIEKENNGIITYEYIDPQKTPTIHQFRYWVKKHQDREEELRSLYGDQEFENSFNILTGSTLTGVKGVGTRAELDATHLPVEIVSETDRSVCLGHPLLELLVDVYSKMVMGFYLTLDNESYETAAITLLNSMKDKAALAREFGVTINPEDWPAHHLPQIILSDNGPFNSRYTQTMEEEYKCEIENAPPRKGSSKGNVERKNKTFEDYVRNSLPGTTKVAQKGRGASDPADEACLTLKEVTGLIIKKIVEFNHTPIRDYPLTPQQIDEGIIATPLNLWNESVSKGNDNLIYENDLNKARIVLLPSLSKKRMIRKEGIRAFNFIYTSKDPVIKNWLINHRGEKVSVIYDPQSVEHIYIVDNEKNIIILDLNEIYKPYSHMSLKEIHYYQKNKKNLENSQKDLVQLKKLETIEMEEKTIRKAKTESNGLKKKKDKKGNRRKEAQRINQEKITQEKQTEDDDWSENIKDKDRRRAELFQERVKEVLAKKK